MKHYLGLDIGTKRVGLAIATDETRLAEPRRTVAPNQVAAAIQELGPFEAVVVGLPRSLAGHDTPQTVAVRRAADDLLGPLGIDPIWQDEAATSAVAEERLKAVGKPYTKADIDAEAASIILQDYLDSL
ncbi:MAG TPA: Holliday junction resolvase RuvX [Candidatus Saccharimonadia bacterium]